jgi:ubiquinone/menaquinone biosynthesis C-methylase UbiE
MRRREERGDTMSERSYDDIAGWYDEYVRRQPIYSEEVLPNLMSLVGDVRGERVCDVACGQGLATRELAKAGADVTGIDLSEPLLALARQYETSDQLGIDYVLDDAQALSSQADDTFDGATCCMALMNIPDLTACLRSVRRIL